MSLVGASTMYFLPPSKADWASELTVTSRGCLGLPTHVLAVVKFRGRLVGDLSVGLSTDIRCTCSVVVSGAIEPSMN